MSAPSSVARSFETPTRTDTRRRLRRVGPQLGDEGLGGH